MHPPFQRLCIRPYNGGPLYDRLRARLVVVGGVRVVDGVQPITQTDLI